MKTKKLLLAGGAYADIPMIHAAKRLGYHVITSGNRPDEMGHLHSDEYRCADFSDREAIAALAAELNVDAICASCNDFSALSAAYAAETLGLPGHDPIDVAEIIHHKDRFRRFALDNGIPSPRAWAFSTRDDALALMPSLPFPLLVKPVDLTGGKGIALLQGVDDAPAVLDRSFGISRAKRVVAEEFIEGTRHGFSAFLRRGRVAFYFTDNEHYYLNPYLVSAATAPGSVPTSAENELCAISERIASLLSLVDGILHIQFILRDDSPVIIEICRRPPGDLYVRLVEHVTGVPYPEWLVRAEAGLDCRDLRHAPPSICMTRHCIMASSPGRVKDIVFDGALEGRIVDSLLWWKKGDPVTDVMTTKFGIVFVRYESSEEMQDLSPRLNDLIRVVME